MPEYTLRIRRYSPETGEAAYWEEFGDRARRAPLGARRHPAGQGPPRRVDRHPLLLPRRDLRLLRRAHQRPPRPGLPHAPRRGRASTPATASITVEPMGNMPVIKDLITDMDAVHWKKIRRVTPWLLPDGDPPEREYIVPKESMVDVTQTMACIQCGACVSDCLSMEVDPEFIGPAALAKAYRFVGDPRDGQQFERLKDLVRGPARHLRLHPLLQLHRGVPEGRRADVPDHAAAAHRRRRPPHRRPQQRPPPRAGVRLADPQQRAAARGRAAAALLRRRLVVRQVPPQGRRRAGRLAAGDRARCSSGAR